MTVSTPTEDTYHRFFKQCLVRRTPISQFERLFQQLHTRFPLPSAALAKVLLSPTLIFGNSDPAHLEYVEWLVSRDHTSAARVLNELLRTSGLKQFTSPGTQSTFTGVRREPLEQDVFLVLVRVINTKKPRSPESVWAMMQALSDWMEAIIAASEAQMLGDSADPAMHTNVNFRGRMETLGELVVAFGAQQDVTRVLGQSGKRDRKLAFLASLSGYVQCVQVFGILGLVPRLEELRQQQQQPSPRASRNLGGAGAAEAIDGMVMGLGDNSVSFAWTRGHLYVWLSSLLAGVPNVDENYVVGYLLSRYKESITEMVTDFMTAVIDVVAHAINKKEPPSTLMILRSFLVNKVPLVLLRLSQFPQILSGAISQAFLRADAGSLQDISPSRFDPYSLNSNDNQDMFDPENMNVDLRSDFLFACALHGIVDESEITTMLGELPVSAMSSSGKYTVEGLQEQYHANHDRADRLLEEIESMEGNAGAVCRTLFEIMKGMCETRATMPLRNFCSFLTRKTSSIDIMLLFVKSSELLEPLCDLLDTWRYEEDQGEYQPVYEEFGSILLFVFTVVRRYSLPVSSLYVTHSMPQDSFVANILSTYETPITNLTSDRYATLGGWIKELFELEGISDSLMSSCSPQEFYCLVPTLFAQTLSAYQYGILDKELITQAFDFLLQPFLLPSIVTGLQVIGNHLWASIDKPDTALSLLVPLILTGESLTAEAAETHRTAISISARQLCTILTTVIQHQHELPKQQQSTEHLNTASKLLTRLRPLQAFTRSCTPTKEDLDSFVHPHGTNISNTLTSGFNVLATWTPNTPLPPATFSPKLLVAARNILGPRKAIHLLLQCCIDFHQHHVQPIPGVVVAPPSSRTGEPEDVLAAILLSYLPASTAIPSFLEAARLVLAELQNQSIASSKPSSTSTPSNTTKPGGGPSKTKPDPSANANNPNSPPSKLEILRTVLTRIDAHLAAIDELGRRQPDQMASLGLPDAAGVDAAAAAAAAAVGMEMDMGVGMEDATGMGLGDGGMGMGDGGMGMEGGLGGGLGGFAEGDMDMMMMDQGMMEDYEGMQFT